MTPTMQAAQVQQFGQPLVLREFKVPTPGAGQILVRTEACGVCHTDLHAANGDWPVKPALPFTPGHEGIGIVAALGAGVTAVKEGDRVGVPWLYSACGHCEYCLAAWEPVCAEAQFGGYTRNGGFADYIVADPNYVAHIPARLSAREAAPLICAGITYLQGHQGDAGEAGRMAASCRALAGSATSPCSTAAPWACRCARSTSTTASSRMPGGWAPRWLLNARQGDPVAEVKQATGGGAHRRADHGTVARRLQAGRGHDPQARHLRAGRAIPPGEFPTPLFDVVANCITIRAPSSATAATWPKPWPLRPMARSRPTSNCNPWRRSTRSSAASPPVTCPRAWCSISLAASRPCARTCARSPHTPEPCQRVGCQHEHKRQHQHQRSESHSPHAEPQPLRQPMGRDIPGENNHALCHPDGEPATRPLDTGLLQATADLADDARHAWSALPHASPCR